MYTPEYIFTLSHEQTMLFAKYISENDKRVYYDFLNFVSKKDLLLPVLAYMKEAKEYKLKNDYPKHLKKDAIQYAKWHIKEKRKQWNKR